MKINFYSKENIMGCGGGGCGGGAVEGASPVKGADAGSFEALQNLFAQFYEVGQKPIDNEDRDNDGKADSVQFADILD